MFEKLHVVCPNCQITNRIASEHLTRDPNCGSCHRPLFNASSSNLDEASFDKHVSRNEIPVLVDFWAPWCGPCHQMAPAFEHAASQLEPDFRLAKVDTQAVHSLAERFNIRSIPTLALFQGGREVARQTGAMSAPDIVRWVQAQALARNLG